MFPLYEYHRLSFPFIFAYGERLHMVGGAVCGLDGMASCVASTADFHLPSLKMIHSSTSQYQFGSGRILRFWNIPYASIYIKKCICPLWTHALFSTIKFNAWIVLDEWIYSYRKVSLNSSSIDFPLRSLNSSTLPFTIILPSFKNRTESKIRSISAMRWVAIINVWSSW